MAFFSKAGNILRQTLGKQINQEISASNPSVFQIIRCMSSSKLFIGGLSYSTDETSLREAFDKYGEVIDARIITDRETGSSRGFGFVSYADSESASSAIQALDGRELHGRQVRVNYANDNGRSSRGYGYGNDSGNNYNGSGNYGRNNYSNGYDSNNYGSNTGNFGSDTGNYGNQGGNNYSSGYGTNNHGSNTGNYGSDTGDTGNYGNQGENNFSSGYRSNNSGSDTGNYGSNTGNQGGNSYSSGYGSNNYGSNTDNYVSQGGLGSSIVGEVGSNDYVNGGGGNGLGASGGFEGNTSFGYSSGSQLGSNETPTLADPGVQDGQIEGNFREVDGRA